MSFPVAPGLGLGLAVELLAAQASDVVSVVARRVRIRERL